MSTRSVIARPVEGPEGSFEGRYHHSDGYPSGVGKCLWELAHTQFAGETHAMLRVLLDDHKAGWSSIFGDFPGPADFSKSAGFDNDWHKRYTANPASAATFPPACYCHGDRDEPDTDFIRDTEEDTDTEWAYVIDPTRETIAVYERAGYPGPEYWKPRGTFPFDGPEPEWEAVS